MKKIQEFHTLRMGVFTSSEISSLMKSDNTKEKKPGAPFYTYRDDVASERYLGSSAKQNADSFACEYGSLVENYVPIVVNDDSISFGYSDCTISHPDDEFKNWWRGTPDGQSKDAVIEIKCPVTAKSYFNLLGITADELKKENPKYYWQIVSNAILTGKDKAELIVFFPNSDDLENIRQMNNDIAEPSYRIDINIHNGSAPCLADDKKHLNLYRLKFDVPQGDKDALTERVRLAIKEVERIIDLKDKRLKK